MSTNLVSLVMQFLTPKLIGRIASTLRLDSKKVQTAISAAVPGLLAAFSGVAAQQGGAQKLVDAARQQIGALDNFASALKGGQSSLVEKGSQMLLSLLGGRDQNALAGALAKFAGLGQSASSSLLGMLAPVVMGTIAQQQGARTLDASRLAGLLSSQKDSIAAALPSGFGNLLGGTGLLDSLGSAARAATAASSEAARVTTSTARAVGDSGLRTTGAAASRSLNWLYWLIPVVAVAALLIYLFAKPTERVVEQRVPTVQSLVVGGPGVGEGGLLSLR